MHCERTITLTVHYKRPETYFAQFLFLKQQSRSTHEILHVIHFKFELIILATYYFSNLVAKTPT